MIYTSDITESAAALNVAQLMCAAARTAPKGRGVDLIETLVLDGEDKDKLAATMREIGEKTGQAFFIRDAGNMEAAHLVVLTGADVSKPRGLNCKLCGVEDCAAASSGGISCALTVSDLGIAVGSAASVAMDNRMDNRIMFSAGMAALKLKLFSDKVGICYGIPLATTGKSIFFDRPAL
ncbi:MAG: DUF2148 domain-containing protein [Oscillospiraceae bacterium]|nr:DUF2148 domain-containing protein [Oscillospiraceae bacterium]